MSDYTILIVSCQDTGHNTPFLGLVKELKKQVPKDKSVKIFWATDELAKGIAERSGCDYVPLNGSKEVCVEQRLGVPFSQLSVTELRFEYLKDFCIKNKIQLIIRDYFSIIARYVAEKLNIVEVSFRSGQPPEKFMNEQELTKIYNTEVTPLTALEGEGLSDFQKRKVKVLKDKYDIDANWMAPICAHAFSDVMNIVQIPLEWLSKEVVSTTSGKFYSVGPSIDARALSAQDQVFVSKIKSIKEKNPDEKMFLISMGTVQARMVTPVIKDQLQLYKSFVEAAKLLKGKAHVIVSLSGLTQYDGTTPFDFEKLNPSENCTLARFVPQLEILKYTDVFFTHCGANSFHESLYSGVSMVASPVFGDQHINTKHIQDNGWGAKLGWEQYINNPELLADTLMEVANDDSVKTQMKKGQALERKILEKRCEVAKHVYTLID